MANIGGVDFDDFVCGGGIEDGNVWVLVEVVFVYDGAVWFYELDGDIVVVGFPFCAEE